MINIFLELWKAQQENQVVIPELYFPETFILEENHDFICLFRSKQEGKILRKKKQNSTIESITKTLTGYIQNQSYDQSSIDSNNNTISLPQMNGHIMSQIPETPCATFSRLNDQGEIEIQHFNAEQTNKFFKENEYKNALPRDSIFLQKFLRTDQNEIHNHFIRVVYNTNFIQIERRRNCFFWQNLTENSNRPKDREYYNCLVSYEGPDQFTQIEKINEFTANQLKYLVKQICIQLESVHSKERGKVKQISLIFKKVNEIIYLLHCNEISFEREQHIPKLWRMSFNHQFVVPMHIKCIPKPLVEQKYQFQQKQLSNHQFNQSQQLNSFSFSEQQSDNQINKESNVRLTKLLHQQQQDENLTKLNSIEQQRFQMCTACGQKSDVLHEVMKNKLLRIRIKRGVRENFNGLRPLYETQQKQEKALFDKYTTVKVCVACFVSYQQIQKEDEQQAPSISNYQSNELYGQGKDDEEQNDYEDNISKKGILNINRKGLGRIRTAATAVGQKTRSKSFNIVSLDESSSHDASLLNGQFLTPLDGSSFYRRKSIVHQNINNLDTSYQIQGQQHQQIQQQQQQLYKQSQQGVFENQDYQNLNLIQQEKSSKTINLERQDDSLFNINKRHHSLSKASQLKPSNFLMNKNLQYKFKELRSKSTQRSQNNSICNQLQIQHEDSFLNDMSFLQKINKNDISSLTPITQNEDQKQINEALSLLEEYNDNQIINNNNNNVKKGIKRVARSLPKSVSRQRTYSIGITPTLKSQNQSILQNTIITPIDRNDVSIQLNNNKSTSNVITNYFNSYENNSNPNTSLSHDNDVFLKKFYQQQIIEKDKKMAQNFVEIQPSSNSNSRDYISINHLSNNQCLRSEDILNKMKDINQNQGKQILQDSHEKIISDYNKIYLDQKYQVQLLKQKSNFLKGSVSNDLEQNNDNHQESNRFRKSSVSSNKSTQNTQSNLNRNFESKRESEQNEIKLLQSIRYLEKQLEQSDYNNSHDNSFDNQKENREIMSNKSNNLISIKQQQQQQQKQQQQQQQSQQMKQKIYLPPKPSLNQKGSTVMSNKIKIPLTQNPKEMNKNLEYSQRNSFQLPHTSVTSMSPHSNDNLKSEQSSKILHKPQQQNNLNTSFDKPPSSSRHVRKIL